MALEREQNAELRERGWRVFRSSTRDHLIPLTGQGAQLQRVRIGEAFPVRGLGVGAEATTGERREAVREARRASESQARDRVAAELPGETVGLAISASNPTANPGPAGTLVDDELLVGFAPFSGFISEVDLILSGASLAPVLVAIRTGSGGTVFRGGETFSPVTQNVPPEPDFLVLVDVVQARTLRGLRTDVLAGEQIFVVIRTQGLAGGNSVELYGTIVMRSTEGIDVAARVQLGTSSAVRAADRAALRESIAQSGRLAIEREKTKRAGLEAEARVSVAALTASARAARASGPMANPFQELLVAEKFAERERTLRPPPAPPRIPPPPPSPPEGTGRTFVPAWMPSAGSIGYLVPTPPRGGKVNVFDGRFSVFDLSGKLVETGTVANIRSDGDIPPGARITPRTGVALPEGV